MAQPSHAAVRSVVITGGLGFLGRLVCRSLLRGVNGGVASAVRVKLVDVDADQMSSPSLSAPSRSDADDRALAAEILEDALGSGSSEQTLHSSVEIVRGNISDSEFCRSIIGDETDSVFHLAAVMSGQGEADFESVMDVNLHGTLNLLEAVRNSGSHGARFLFASSGAVFGSTANESAHYTQMHAQDNPPPARDSTKHLPESSYGMTKSCCELLVNDYTRRGFVIGRSARLPTVVVRPGAPNAATTSVFSSVVRDTLEGIACESPLSLDLSHAVVSHRTAVDSVIQLHDTDEGEFLRLAPFAGLDRAVNLHATSVTLGELYEETSRIVQKGQDKPRENLGPLHVNINEKLEGIVASMPSRIESATAKALGLPGAHHTARDLVRIYCEDFAPHIDTSPHESDISASAGRDASVVAFMGLGNMGKSMARNIINSGNFEEVRLWNRTKESAQTFAVSMENIHYRGSGPTTKVTVCDSPREAAEGASVTMICLGTEKACEDVLLDPDSGLLTRDGDGESGRETVIVDHSTVSPDLTHRCHDLANQADGVVFLDCPISGGPEGAAGGTLSVMCGGDESAFAVAKPVLECMGSNVIHMGEGGTGTAAKLVNQLLVGIHATASSEALALAKALDLDLGPDSKLLPLLAESWGQSRIFERNGSVIASANGDFASRELESSSAPVRNIVKDLEIIINAASNDLDLDLRAAEVARAVYKHYATTGFGGADMAIAARYYGLPSLQAKGRKRAGITRDQSWAWADIYEGGGGIS